MKSLFVKYANGHKSRYGKVTSLYKMTASNISDMLFSVFMSCMVTNTSKISGMGYSAEKNDAYYFELGCFYFFELDVWHFVNGYNEFRDIWFNDWIANKFLSLFQKSMKTDHLSEILNNRLNLYAQIKHEYSETEKDIETRRQKEWERMSFFFEQFALRALKNNKTEIYDASNFPVWIEGINANMAIMAELGATVTTMIPVVMKAFKYIYDSVRRDAKEQDTGIKEKTKYCQECGEYVTPTFHDLCPNCDGPLL
jgi:hypothetical protein